DLLRALAWKRGLGERRLRARQAEHLCLRLRVRLRLRRGRLGSVPLLGRALEREVALVEGPLAAGLGIAGLELGGLELRLLDYLELPLGLALLLLLGLFLLLGRFLLFGFARTAF